MRRTVATLALAAMVVVAGTLPAAADGGYHSEHITLTPIGESPLRSGFVENIHAEGPNIYAHEQYVLNGAEPNTTYTVHLTAFLDPGTCSQVAFAADTATIYTNAAGNGTAYHVFTPADADGLRGFTVGGMWTVSGGTSAYTTECATIPLD